MKKANETFLIIVGTILLTKGIWGALTNFFDKYSIGLFILIIIGFVILILRDRIVRIIPYKNQAVDKIIGLVPALLIGYAVWEYASSYPIYFSIVIGGVILVFRDKLSEIIGK